MCRGMLEPGLFDGWDDEGYEIWLIRARRKMRWLLECNQQATIDDLKREIELPAKAPRSLWGLVIAGMKNLVCAGYVESKERAGLIRTWRLAA